MKMKFCQNCGMPHANELPGTKADGLPNEDYRCKDGEFTHNAPVLYPSETLEESMIETERLILRPWREIDADTLFRYASDPDIGPAAGWPPHTSVENSREIIRTVFAAPETYAVVLKETGEPVGSCGIMFGNSLHSANMKVGEAEIGYWIGKPYWGRGLIPEAVGALLERSFNELKLNAVWCGYYDGNVKSKRVCEKSGFKYHHTDCDVISPLGDKRTEHFYIMRKRDYNAMYVDREHCQSMK